MSFLNIISISVQFRSSSCLKIWLNSVKTLFSSLTVYQLHLLVNFSVQVSFWWICLWFPLTLKFSSTMYIYHFSTNISLMDFWRFSQKVQHSHVSVKALMDFLNIFPKSLLLSCINYGFLKLFSKKSIILMFKWWTF